MNMMHNGYAVMIESIRWEKEVDAPACPDDGGESEAIKIH